MEIYISECMSHTYDCVCYAIMFKNEQMCRNINESLLYNFEI